MTYDKTPNYICLMTELQFNKSINAHWKTRAWIKIYDESGGFTYQQRTWKELSEDHAYKILYGATPLFENCTYKGVNLGNRYNVSGRVVLELNDKEKFKALGFDQLLTFSEANDFLIENAIEE